MTEEKSIICPRCKRIIEDGFYIFEMRFYHQICATKQWKEWIRIQR